MISLYNQFWAHIIASIVLGCSLLWCELKSLPLVLKAASEATVVTGMAKISLAILCKAYLRPLLFHHAKISKSSLLFNTPSLMKWSNSILPLPCFFELLELLFTNPSNLDIDPINLNFIYATWFEVFAGIWELFSLPTKDSSTSPYSSSKS